MERSPIIKILSNGHLYTEYRDFPGPKQDETQLDLAKRYLESRREYHPHQKALVYIGERNQVEIDPQKISCGMCKSKVDFILKNKR